MSKFFEAASKLDPSLIHSVLTEPASRQADQAPAAVLVAPPPAPAAAPAPMPPAPVAAPPVTPSARLAAIPYAAEFAVNDRTTKAVLPFDGSAEDASERYRILRTKILHHPMKPKVLCV